MASWSQGIFSCFNGAWCCACWCPCVMYSRNRYRLNNPQDSDLNDFSNCTGSCWAWCCLQSWTGCGGTILQMLQRSDIREKLNIEGGSCGDCVCSWCCSCCVFVQSEEELKNPAARQKLLGHAPGTYGGEKPQQYQAQQPMAYGQPQQQQQQYNAHQYNPQQGYPQQGYQPQQTGVYHKQ